MPSCTIVPEVIATSVTSAPHPLPTVPMSMPWSSVQALIGSTREIGASGNAHPDVVEVVLGSEAPDPVAIAVTWARSAAAVRLPTVPLAGTSALARWNLATADLVIGPK